MNGFGERLQCYQQPTGKLAVALATTKARRGQLAGQSGPVGGHKREVYFLEIKKWGSNIKLTWRGQGHFSQKPAWKIQQGRRNNYRRYPPPPGANPFCVTRESPKLPPPRVRNNERKWRKKERKKAKWEMERPLRCLRKWGAGEGGGVGCALVLGGGHYFKTPQKFHCFARRRHGGDIMTSFNIPLRDKQPTVIFLFSFSISPEMNLQNRWSGSLKGVFRRLHNIRPPDCKLKGG